MNKDNTDNCPACGVPYTEHLGLEGTCRQLQEYKSAATAEADEVDERGLEIQKLKAEVLHKKALVEDLKYHLTNRTEENKRLREALEQAKEKMDHARYIVTNCHPTNLLPTLQTEWIDTALSPSDPAERKAWFMANAESEDGLEIGAGIPPWTELVDAHQPPSVSDKPCSVKPVSDKGEWREAAEQAWRKLPHRARGSEPTLNFLQGFQFGWNHPFRRFHPATTNQEESVEDVLAKEERLDRNLTSFTDAEEQQ